MRIRPGGALYAGGGDLADRPHCGALCCCWSRSAADAAGAPRRSSPATPTSAAALLHDVGHFEAIGHRQTPAQQREPIDYKHQETGAAWLAQWFPAEVTEPVRLHVMAKRYLCAVEPDYLARLSPASVQTLALQGGPLTEAEARAFARLPHAQAAVSVRRWDDEAKDPALTTPTFDHFRQLLSQLTTR